MKRNTLNNVEYWRNSLLLCLIDFGEKINITASQLVKAKTEPHDVILVFLLSTKKRQCTLLFFLFMYILLLSECC